MEQEDNKVSIDGYNGPNWENYLGVLPALWLFGSFNKFW